ncbi:MAG: hypothetical protein IT462_17330 [Planctomycetes bacterium]|nr:hypothetical protein [Planctomycetota bacterium]
MYLRYLFLLSVILGAVALNFGCASNDYDTGGGGENPALRSSPPDATGVDDTEYVLLAETNVYYTTAAEPSYVVVQKYEPKYSTIVLQADDNDVEYYDFVIVYDDGHTFVPGNAVYYSKADGTYEIIMPQDRRIVKKIEYRCRNLPEGKKARLEIWAK